MKFGHSKIALEDRGAIIFQMLFCVLKGLNKNV
jgi:hypothetical protein